MTSAFLLYETLTMKREELFRSEHILAQLAEGTASFEFEPSNTSFASVSAAFSPIPRKEAPGPCFARIAGAASQVRAKSSPATKKLEHFTVQRVAGDGRCMFRALVLGLAANKGAKLNSYEEEQEADQLRLAVRDAICRNGPRAVNYEEALIAITLDESLDRYCERIPSPRFWGGESELLVLSKMCNVPIMVYIPESEAKKGRGSGYVQIAEYGSEFKRANKGKKPRKPVRLLYSAGNHYDLLV